MPSCLHWDIFETWHLGLAFGSRQSLHWPNLGLSMFYQTHLSPAPPFFTSVSPIYTGIVRLSPCGFHESCIAVSIQEDFGHAVSLAYYTIGSYPHISRHNAALIKPGSPFTLSVDFCTHLAGFRDADTLISGALINVRPPMFCPSICLRLPVSLVGPASSL